MRLGVCYYPEHWPRERWPVDARMMREAGLSIVRIGEFAWKQIEPRENRFEWEWLDRAVETLAAEQMQIVLGTPTAAPPAWLCRAHPDILPVDPQGRRRQFGSRRHYCASSPVYRQHTTRIVAALGNRYGRHPAVVGWQIDNEFGCHDTARCYCDVCADGFRQWLSARYGSLPALNDAWGTAFWSQGYGDWSEVDPPRLTVTEPNPSHVLDYYRFSSDTVAAYQQIQLSTLRSLIPDRQFTTTNFMGHFPDLDYHALARPLDLVTWDSYPTGYAEVQAESLYSPGEDRPRFAYDVGDPHVTGFCHDLTRGLKPETPFWVMEQQCGHVNWSAYNTGVRPGTVRLWTWHALASGAEAVLFFRWRACLFAQEQHHSGLLHHDASIATGLEDVLAMLADRALMDQVAAQPVHAQVALLLDYADLWAIQLQPHRRDFGYLRHLFVFYRALQALGIPTDIVPPTAGLDSYRLVLAPTAFLAGDGLTARLTDFAAKGGTVLLGVRSGFKTASNLVTDRPLPGVFRDLVGVTVTDWHSLPPGVGFDLQASIPGLTGPTTLWAESLHSPAINPGSPISDTRPLARYTSGPFSGRAALTENKIGDGRALYLGWYPSAEQARALLAHLARAAGVHRLAELPHGLVAARRGRHTVLLNFTDQALTASLGDESVAVPPRDLRVVASDQA